MTTTSIKGSRANSGDRIPQRSDSVQLSLRRSALDKAKPGTKQRLNMNNFNDFSTTRIQSLKSQPRTSSTSYLSDLRLQMLAQAKRATSFICGSYNNSMVKRAQTDPKLNENRLTLSNEKKVLSSFTQLVESKTKSDSKNSLVFKVLERKIKNYLIKSGKCHDKKKLDEAAKKMAAFVSDVMKETYKTREASKVSAKVDGKVGNRGDSKVTNKSDMNANRSDSSIRSNLSRARSSSSRVSMKSALEPIQEEKPRVKKGVRSSSTDSKREPKASPAKTLTKVTKNRPSTNPGPIHPPLSKQNKILVRNRDSSSDSIRSTNPKINNSSAKAVLLPSASCDSITIKNEKDKINSWLDEVSDRTRKWTDWISQTISKAEQSKRKLQRGISMRDVSGESVGDLPSNIWKSEKEAFRGREQESIQQWMLRNKINQPTLRSPSSLSFNTNSAESSLYSVWSSREPSSIYAGESELARLQQLGVIKPNFKM